MLTASIVTHRPSSTSQRKGEGLPFLSYYENFDTTLNNGNGAPSGKKGMVSLHQCRIKKKFHKGRLSCFMIERPDGSQLHLCAPNENMRCSWVETLKRASELDFADPFGTEASRGAVDAKCYCP